MLTLREALQHRAAVPGYIDIVVARPSAFQPALAHCCSSDVLTETPPPTLKPPHSHGDKSSRKTAQSGVATKTTKGVSRNMSYQLANGDSFVSDNSALSTPLSGAVVTKSVAAMKAPTINGGHADTVLIETDESQPSSVSSPLHFSIICF